MSIPQQPTQPGAPAPIEEPIPATPESPEDAPDTPAGVPEPMEPDWRAPGNEEPPMQMPREDPEAET